MTSGLRLRPAVQGDVNDIRTLRLDGVDDLAAANDVTVHVWKQGTTPVALPASVLDAAERTVRFSLGGSGGWLATATPSTYWQLEIQVTFGDGTVLTWPGGDPLRLSVRPQGDPPTPTP